MGKSIIISILLLCSFVVLGDRYDRLSSAVRYQTKQDGYTWNCYEVEGGGFEVWFDSSNKRPVGSFVIPSRIDGRQIVSIPGLAAGDFEGLNGITNLVVSEGIENIDSYAFRGCENLKVVSLPSTLLKCGSNAFQGCMKIEDVSVPLGMNTSGLNGNIVYKDYYNYVDWWLHWPFEDSVKNVSFKYNYNVTGGDQQYGLEGIRWACLANMSKLEYVYIPEGAIGVHIVQCERLTSISLPTTIKSIGPVLSDVSFSRCDSLEAIFWLGDAPYLNYGWSTSPRNITAKNVFDGLPYGLTLFVAKNSAGWDETRTIGNTGNLIIKQGDGILPETWGGRSIKRITSQQQVKFDGNGGSADWATRLYDVGSDFHYLPNAARHGYRFLGWFTTPDGGVEVTEDTLVSPAVSVIYAHWERMIIYVTISFNPCGGTVSEANRLVEADSAIGSLPTPIKKGYVFTGWHTSSMYGGREVVPTTIATEDMTLFAYWEQDSEIKCTVTFDANGGTVSPLTMQCSSGSSIGTLPVPTRSGYDFIGWFTAPSGGCQVSTGTVVAKNETWYAHWTQNVTYFTVCFDANGGTVYPSTKQCASGSCIDTLPVPTRNGYDFVGWFTAPSGGIQVSVGTVITKNETWYAQWAQKETHFIVYFDANGGKCSTSSVTFVGGTAYGNLPQAKRFGYDFLGWFTLPEGGDLVTADMAVTADRTLYAHWNKNQGAATAGLIHRWSFNGTLQDSVCGSYAKSLGGDSWASDGKSICLSGGSHGTSGIDLGENLLPADGSPVTIELWAKNRTIRWWSRIFDVGAGTNGRGNGEDDAFLMSWSRDVQTQTDRIEIWNDGSSLGELNEKLSPYELNRWYHIAIVIEPNRDADGQSAITFVKHDLLDDSATKEFSWKTGTPWGISNLTQNVFYLGRSSWTGDTDASADYDEVRIWNCALSLEELAQNALQGPDADISEYGLYVVKFDACGGEASEVSRRVLMSEPIGSLPTATRNGYTFGGWFISSTEVSAVTADTIVDGPVTYYAHWTPNRCTILFDANGGSVSTSCCQCKSGDTIDPLPVPTRTGYVFGGWYTSPNGGARVDEPVSVTESVTFYAHWRMLHTVTFNPNGGVVSLSHAEYADGGTIGILPVPTKGGHVFDGWHTAPIGGLEIQDTSVVSSDLVLYAHWSEKTGAGYQNIDGVVWNYSIRDGRAQIEADGDYVGDLAIPTQLGGSIVSSIGQSAFCDCKDLISVKIADGVEVIGTHAFCGCSSIRELAIPFSVTNIGSYAFSGCSPTSVTISAGFDLAKVFPGCASISTLAISEGTTIIPEYYGCQNTYSGLRKVILPSTLRSIESRAFRGCSVQDIVFNEGVTNIDFWAFADCAGIERIELPRSLQRLATTAFGNCANLKSITFPNGNDVYESVGGAVYDQGGTRLVRCPGGAKACQMKSGVVSIGAYALWGCELLESVVIPASVAEIGSCAFWNSGDDFHFEGNRPSAKDADVWGPTTAKVCVYFKAGAVGWVDGGKWCGVTTRSEGGAISTFTIVFNPDQGVGGGSFVIEEGSGLDQLPSCSRSGYTFLGWYTSENGGVRITSLTNVMSDAEYFARWERNSIVDYQIENGCAIITKGATTAALSGDVVIPSTIEGHPVVAIAGSAFVRNTNVTSLTLPKSVKEIGDYAFFGCRALTTIDLGSVTNIGWHAFTSCCGLKSVTLPGCLETLQGYTFENCSSLERISIPSSVRRIAGDFAACDALKSVSLADGLLEIGDRAFEGCVSLSSIVIPKTVEIVSGNAFSGCERLTALSVSADNPYFSSVDGLLLSKDGRVLVTAAAGCKSFLIPSSVVDVGEESFYGAAVQTLVLPSSVTNIGAAAFFGCENLSSISLAEGVKCIGDEVFVGCTSLGAIVLPATVSYVGDNAFIENGLTNVTFLGNAPSVGTSIYACMDDNFCTYVNRGSKGWSALGSEILPSLWQNYPIRYVSDTPDSSSYGPYVPGEKVSVTVSALVGYTAKGLPSGLKLNKKTGEISGSPTKPTGDAGVTATFTKKGAETLTLKFVVGAIPTINVALQGDTERCKVTGANKSYLVGKKVSLSASSPKGTAFVGWYKNGEPWPSASECTKTKLSYVMTKESLNLTARFEKEKMSLACPGLANTEFTAGVAADVAGIPLEITTQSGVKSVKATKLPTGMKLVQDKTSKTWSITGAPTKAGTYNVVLSVTAVSGAVQSITIPVTVEALPSWLVGTYTGMVGRGVGENWMAYGTLSLTVAATGKISAKVVVPSGSYSFTATRWDENLDDAFAVQMKTKKGETLSLIVDGALPWYEARISDAESGNMFSIPNVEPFRVVAWRNEFGKDGEIAKDPTASDFISKIIALKNVALRVTGGKSEGYDLSLLSANDRTADLKLAFDAKGNVKYSGKVDGVSVSGKTVLRIDGSDCYTLLDLVVPIKKAEVMYFAFGFERDELHNPEYDFEIMRMDYQ